MFSPPGGAPSVLLGALGGLLLGGCLPRVGARLSVPRGEPPRACCRSCATPYRGPLGGWLHLGGPCANCRASGRGLLTAAVTALVWGLLCWCVGPRADLPALLGVGLLGVLLALIDLDCLRLPNSLVGGGLLAAAVLLAGAAAASDAWAAYGAALEGAAALFGVYLVLHLLAPRSLGRGDVNLAALLGLCLGWLGGLPAVLLGFCAASLAGLPRSLQLLLSPARGKGRFPYGPPMLAGALAAACWFAALR